MSVTTDHFDVLSAIADGKDWRNFAACKDVEPELFFPIGSKSSHAKSQITEAKSYCDGCPVRARCLAYALDNGLDSGVFGGTDEDERRAIRKAQARR